MHIGRPDHPSACMTTGAALGFFGPATVTCRLDREVELAVDMPGDAARPWARLAISPLYCPEAGDVVLAVAAGEDWYVIGVLQGRGASVLAFPGDLEIRAGGSIRLTAAEDCAIAAAEVRVEAATLELAGDTLRAEFDTIRQRAAGLLETRAQQISTVVGETWRLVARRVLGRATDVVTIDAPSINLG